MPEQPELWAALLPVVDVLKSLDVAYYIGGSVASSYAGVARATQDADLVADLRIVHAMPLAKALEESYYVSSESVLEAVRKRKSFNVIHLETAFKIDVFVLPADAFARQAMARRIALEIPELDRTLDFCSPEDLVLSKLRWYEMGNRVSDRQWYDLQGVLRLQSEQLDLARMRHWARELDLEEIFRQALSEAGLDDSEAEGR